MGMFLQVFVHKIKCLTNENVEPDDGATWNVRGSLNLLQFIPRWTKTSESSQSIQTQSIFSVWTKVEEKLADINILKTNTVKKK